MIDLLAQAAPEGFPAWVYIILTAVGSAGLGGAIAAASQWRKSKPEATRIVVDAAEGAVVVQSGVIKSLREDVVDLRTRVDELTRHLTVVESERDRYKVRVAALEEERDDLRDRVAALEAEVNVLKRGNG